MPAQSYLLRNDTENGKLNTSALDLKHHGWWNSLAAGDIDQDGDIDYLVGNLGLNSRHQASVEKPLCVYAKDYDRNGRIDPVFCQFIGAENYLAHPRDLLIQQINAMRVRFKSYETYGQTPFEKSFTPEELSDAYLLKSDYFSSAYLENLGNGQFKISALPMDVQIAPVFGMHVEDFDQDGNLDVLLAGNSYATEVAIGRYDASKGLVLSGDSQGNFQAKKYIETGFRMDGDAKGMARLFTKEDQALYLLSTNSDSLHIFQHSTSKNNQRISLSSIDQYVVLTKKDGRKMKIEGYHGSTYLTQSSRDVLLVANYTKVEVVNNQGEKRTIPLNEKTLSLIE